ncbi:MAG TPA: molybdopterin molybdenumtransferase MoeA [Opitutae bacterium]|nr:molybdopterin molybdenumtransferase MoeA [Puniceicoccaceae bacterium]HBR92724.1 molybdopterin molybdenumtransferase MoeA [Opitutae bacterium]|tara:strand:- start:10123 stop:11328 length:1206 start_codon:yes stop_codon:yes gene_type:complete
MRELITPALAQQRILAALQTQPSETCALEQCAGRILRAPVLADRPFPPFDRSMMDGYAIRAAEIDGDGRFTIVTQAPAGAPAQQLGHQPRACAEIMTGAVLPTDADCVVPYEQTRRIDSTQMQVLEPTQHAAGDCIHGLASDRPAGEALLTAGRRIGSREIAIAASCGCERLVVSKKPSIVIVSTGDELVDIVATPAAHQIRRSNDIMMEAALQHFDLPAAQFAHLPDNAAAPKAQLKALIADHDIVILSGGISMGKKDFIPDALDALGLDCQFHGVAQKPGKPLGFWSQPACAVFTLPGNPLSTLTCLHQYVIPALFHSLGQAAPTTPHTVRLDAGARARDDLTIFLPVSLHANNIARPQPANNSGDLVRILQSDGYIELPPCKEKSYPAGKSFDFHPWH